MEYKLMDKYIGETLYVARVTKRITQDQMTNMINEKLKKSDMSITRQTYANYEHGVYSISQGVFEASCTILGLDWKKVFTEAVDYMMKDINA